MPRALLSILLLISTACGTTPSAEPAPTTSTSTTSTSTTSLVATTSTTASSSVQPSSTVAQDFVVSTGSTVLVESDFAHIDGKRIGLIAHQVSVVYGEHLGDLLHRAPNVELVAMFGPEHGVRGDADAGEYVEDAIDPATGVPVYSLFGPTRQPTPEMLAGIDVLLYDLQDVGTRYYTYISTMGLAMQAAAEAGVEFVVLDRPNPLGGTVDGGMLDTSYESFVGLYPIADVYGLTAGELATWVQAELLSSLETLDLTVIEMDGWTRSMRWEDTGLEWVAPSPAITTPNAALLYPTTIYFEALSLSYGRGTSRPFQVIGAPWLDPVALIADLESRGLDGIGFVETTITPAMLRDMTVEPAYLGETIPAVDLIVTNNATLRPASVGVHVLDAVFAQARNAGVDPLARPEWLDQLSGSELLRRSLTDNPLSVEELLASQAADRELHDSTRDAFVIYG